MEQAFWKPKFGPISTIEWICWFINAHMTPTKTVMTSHLKYLGKNLEIEFSNQF